MLKTGILLVFGSSLVTVLALNQYAENPEFGGNEDQHIDVIVEEDSCKDDEFWPMFSDDSSFFQTSTIYPSDRQSSLEGDESSFLLARLFSDDVISGNVTSGVQNTLCRFGGSLGEPLPDGDTCCRT